tara:strand:- start:7054 stop:7689 length:636 start_codon:yes stop_codon:yes gene_type:complete
MHTPTLKQTELLQKISSHGGIHTTGALDMRIANPLIKGGFLSVANSDVTLTFQAKNYLALMSDNTHSIPAPYSIKASINRNAKRHIVLAGNYERPTFKCDDLVVESDVATDFMAQSLADKLNAEMLPKLNEIINVYQRHYANAPLGADLRVIVRRDDEGRLGWSFNRPAHKNGEFVTRGDTVTLADGRTTATVLFVFDDRQLKENLSQLGQ